MANHLMSQVRPISAAERAARAVEWTSRCLAERAAMPADQREARAAFYDDRATHCLTLTAVNPRMLELAGLHCLAANIMRAERVG